MARELNKLSTRKVATIKEPGLYSDGGGLYLQATPGRSEEPVTKAWLLRYTFLRKARMMGLGRVRDVTLQAARIKASECRRLLLEGIDPVAARDASKEQAKADADRMLTFSECAAQYIGVHKDGWKNAKHVSQWTTTLKEYAYPIMGNLPISAVTSEHIMRCLQPIWNNKNPTAERLRTRIASILDWAKAKKYRSGDNPAEWKGNLSAQLPKPSKVHTVKNQPSLPYAKISEFVRALRQREGAAALALEFTILTAARTGAVTGAVRGEFDLDAGVWTVPAGRMKAKREHRVPLSPRAAEIVEQMLKGNNEDHVFPGGTKGKGRGVGEPLSVGAMAALLQRMGYACNDGKKFVVHGFRSTFRDWAAEQTNYPHAVCEAALAHKSGDKVEAAYQRSDLIEKRRLLMADWSTYCAAEKTEAKVLPMRKQKA